MEKLNVIEEHEDICIRFKNLINQHVKHRRKHEQDDEKNRIKKVSRKIKGGL